MNKHKACRAVLGALLFGSIIGAPAAEAAAKDVNVQEAVKTGESDTKPHKAVVLSKAPPAYDAGQFCDSSDARYKTGKVFPYNPANIYKIYCQPGYITDLELHPGDRITYAGAGDTMRWIIDQAVANGAPHLYVKPVEEGTETNLVINTDRHSYQIVLASGDWHLPMASWSYKVEAAMEASQHREKAKLQAEKEKKTLLRWKKNLRYEVKVEEGKMPEWAPQKVYDDGVKTYLHFSGLSKTLPVLFIADGKTFKPANYRVVGNHFVMDGIFERAALKTPGRTVWLKNQAVRGE